MAYRVLGDILVSGGAISREELEKNIVEARKARKRIGEYLVEQGLITDAQLIEVLQTQLGLDFVDLNTEYVAPQLTALVPKETATFYNVIPVKEDGDDLYLAMVDPLNFKAIEEVKQSTKRRIIPMIATKDGMERAISVLYGAEGVSKAIDELQAERNAILGEDADNKQKKEEADDAPAIRIVDTIIERGVMEKASDIHIEPREDALVVRMRIDGVLRVIQKIPNNMQAAIISRIKIMGDMDIAEKRIPLDGRSNYRKNGKDIDLRISSLPTKYGEKIVIRFLEKTRKSLTIEGIGMQGKHLKDYKELLKNSNGVILITGPTGSGKSTTMSAMISELNKEDVNVITLEDPIEYEIKGVNQVQVNEKAGLTFAAGLRSILRQDPDIISVGEIRDGETAEIAMRAAITGHLVLSTIHTNSAIATIDRLEDIGVEPYLISSALRGVLAQRLVRKLCPNCKEEYTPTDDELAELEMKRSDNPNIKFYRACGCSECLQIGYKGRTGVFELLVLDTEEKQLIRESAPQSELIRAVKKNGFTTLKDDVTRLVLNGTTTIQEAMRILHTTDF